MAIKRAFVTIPASGTTSEAFDLMDQTLLGVRLPSGFQAADLTLLVSNDNVVFLPLYVYSGNSADQWKLLGASAGKHIANAYGDILGARWIKIVSSVTQTASRLLELSIREVT